MSIIHKYYIPVDFCRFSHDMPNGAIGLSLQLQNGFPQLWCLVDPSSPVRTYNFLIVGTGYEFDSTNCAYIATFQLNGLVYHCFCTN